MFPYLKRMMKNTLTYKVALKFTNPFKEEKFQMIVKTVMTKHAFVLNILNRFDLTYFVFI